ncbi:hypothetical protein V8E51_011616 [Hyaloscypha variabilis]
MRTQLYPGISHIHQFLAPAAFNCTRFPSRPRKDYVTVWSQRYSSTSRWTEEDASRIYVHGLGNVDRFIANSLAPQEARPRTTFLVHSNQRIEHFVANNGDVEMIEDGVSYVCDGFDIEIVHGPPIYERSGVKSHRFKSLTLPKRAEFSTELELNLEDTYSNYDHRPQDFGDVTTLSGHYSAFNCAWDNQFQTVRSRPLPRRLDYSDIRPLYLELAKNLQSPIKSLVVAANPECVVSVLLQLKHRLRPDSTILFVHMQKVVGVLEDLNKNVFPDPSNRPNYLVGLAYHSLWSRPKTVTRSTTSRVLSDLTIAHANVVVSSDQAFTAMHRPIGCLLIGPLIKDRPNESPAEYAKRARSTRYLLSAFLGATPLGTEIINNTAINSVVQPMCIMFDCFNGDILQGTDRQAHARRLLLEASRVVQADFPRLTYAFLEKIPWPLCPSLVMGSTTAIEYVNGWIVRRGTELGIPCPENAAMVEYVKEATKEVIEIKEKIIEARAALRRQGRRNILALQHQENGEERRIHIEKGELHRSAKPKPAFEKPAIMRLGNSALLSKVDQKTDGSVEDPTGTEEKSSTRKKKKKGRVAPFKLIL